MKGIKGTIVVIKLQGKNKKHFLIEQGFTNGFKRVCKINAVKNKKTKIKEADYLYFDNERFLKIKNKECEQCKYYTICKIVRLIAHMDNFVIFSAINYTSRCPLTHPKLPEEIKEIYSFEGEKNYGTITISKKIKIFKKGDDK